MVGSAMLGRWYCNAKNASNLCSLVSFRELTTDQYGALPQLPQRRVVVTGLGLVSPLGIGVSQSWQSLIQGLTGVRKLVEEDLPEVSACAQSHRAAYSQLPSKVIACVSREELSQASAIKAEDPKRTAPFISFALCAAAEALEDAAWQPDTDDQRRYTGIAVGSGMSCTAEVADVGVLIASNKLRRLSPFFVPRILVNMAAGAISIRYGLQGPNHAASTACATGVHGVGDAFRMIQRGDAEVMVAGATEACIDAVSLSGFGRMKALSTAYNDEPHRASRPFDAGRDGFVMGEGAGMLVLEELEHARSRGARMYAEVRGYGLSGDGFHITQPHPEGRGAVLAMQRALAGSGVHPASVAYINAHATSTPRGDEIEQVAIRHVFGEEAVQQLLVSSTKGATGHLLGAAGAVETVFTVLALHHGLAPPTVNLEQPDPQLLPGLVRQASMPLRPGPSAALCNSFGFGGTNTALLLTTPPPS